MPHTPNTITELRDGLVANLSTIPGLTVEGWYPELINPPVAIVMGPDISFDADMDCDSYSFPVSVFTGEVSDKEAQAMLDDFCAPASSRSVRAAINSDPTLGGAAQYCAVTHAQRYGIHDYQNQRIWGIEFTVYIVALRTPYL
jgi:hypothetical protein